MNHDEPPMAIVKPRDDAERSAYVIRITEAQIVIGSRLNSPRTQTAYRRDGSHPPNAWGDPVHWTITNTAEIDAFANAHGGTWKRKEAKG